jgi:hypothetical protein
MNKGNIAKKDSVHQIKIKLIQIKNKTEWVWMIIINKIIKTLIRTKAWKTIQENQRSRNKKNNIKNTKG